PRRSVAPTPSLAHRAQSGAAPAPARGPRSPSLLGPAEVAALGEPALAGGVVAGALHRGPLLPASRPRHRAPPGAPSRLRRTPAHGDGYPERGLDHRLQGPVQAGRWHLLLPAHRGGWLQPNAARLSGPHQHPVARGPARLRASLPRVWPAPA